MANQYLNQFLYSFHRMPVLLDCNFVVDSTNGNGLGIRNLKGQGIQNVFMHTSATPATGNPNPASGYIMVQLSDNYNRNYGGFDGFVSPVSGTPITITAANLTAGQLYTIVSLGSSTAADWLAVGVPNGVTPAVGVSFIAISTGAGAGTGAVEVPAASGSGIIKIEGVGDSNLMNPSSNIAQGIIVPPGMYLNFQCLAATNSSTTTMIATAPANGSVVSLKFYLNNSSVKVDGE